MTQNSARTGMTHRRSKPRCTATDVSRTRSKSPLKTLSPSASDRRIGRVDTAVSELVHIPRGVGSPERPNPSVGNQFPVHEAPPDHACDYVLDLREGVHFGGCCDGPRTR